jgi:hypothetical protein
VYSWTIQMVMSAARALAIGLAALAINSFLHHRVGCRRLTTTTTLARLVGTGGPPRPVPTQSVHRNVGARDATTTTTA